MKFLIYRASAQPIGDDYELLDSVICSEKEYGIIEIKNLDELPKDRFVLAWHTDNMGNEALDAMGLSESYVDGTIIIYDDYIE